MTDETFPKPLRCSDHLPALFGFGWSDRRTAYESRVNGVETEPPRPHRLDWFAFSEQQHYQYHEVYEGAKVRGRQKELTNPKYPWLRGRQDGQLPGKHVFEVKGVSQAARGGWGEPGSDEVPDLYEVQARGYMLLGNYKRCKFSVSFAGEPPVYFYLERDRGWDDLIIEVCEGFWNDHILKNDPPEYDFDANNVYAQVKRFRPDYEEGQVLIVEEDDPLYGWFEVEQECADLIARYSKTREFAQAHLLASAGTSQYLVFGGQCFERKKTKRAGYTVAPSESESFKRKKTPLKILEAIESRTLAIEEVM